MKALIFSTIFLFASTSMALPYPNQVLVQELTEILAGEMQASDGVLLELNCDSITDGILCDSKIRLFDTVPFGSLQGGGEETCQELMEFHGGEQYTLVCSSCEYAKNYDLFKKDCISK